MNIKYFTIVGLVITIILIAVVQGDKDMTYNELTPGEEAIIIHKGTEMPFTGEYLYHCENGTYLCKRCDTPLYSSDDKFDSHCGWPSFDDEIPGAVKRLPDSDGVRTEIQCANCGAHLGHVFIGEGLTEKNLRHCVNSISLKFTAAAKADPNDPNDSDDAGDPNDKKESDNRTVSLQKAYFAGGCFWWA